MKRTRRSTYVRFLAAFCVLGVLGLASTLYVLAQERVVLPFQDVYSISAEFAEADGVNGGQGQPVNVAGVKVGQITAVRLVDGRARIAMQIKRALLPRVYGNATAALEPITPLKDMQIALAPGDASAPPLPAGAVIPLRATSAPVPLEDLLSRLDADTRTYLSSLLASLDQGTAGRNGDLRRALVALGPSATEARRLTTALAARRRALARLVHNLAIVSRAASRDDALRTVVQAGNQTLAALVAQDRPLRQAIRGLPETLDDAGNSLERLRPFAGDLHRALTALTPSVRRLPSTLDALDGLARTGTPALSGHLRPAVREARRLTSPLAPAVADLTQTAPALTGIAKTLNYALNELAYNPPGDDEGFLFWTAWAAHNLNSALSTGDAHGTIVRLMLMATCRGLQSTASSNPILQSLGTCPR